MSGRRRGRGRAQAGDQTSDASSQPARGGIRGPAQFDGPASRGSQSASRRASNAPSVTSGSGQPAPSDAQSATATGSVSALTTGVQQMGIGLDPALDSTRRPVLTTDAVRDVDIPASWYNINGLTVSGRFRFLPFSHLHPLSTSACPAEWHGFNNFDIQLLTESSDPPNSLPAQATILQVDLSVSHSMPIIPLSLATRSSTNTT